MLVEPRAERPGPGGRQMMPVPIENLVVLIEQGAEAALRGRLADDVRQVYERQGARGGDGAERVRMPGLLR